jgi:hypothetical protein
MEFIHIFFFTKSLFAVIHATGRDLICDDFARGIYIPTADTPYSQRSLPPYNLDTDPKSPQFPYNYHIYEVLKTLTVVGGPIAPWFGQPGLGTQFYIGKIGNITTLIKDGYLERVDTSELIAPRTPCG